MPDHKKGRIGIFEYDWALYSFVKELAIKLTEQGYLVDFFQKDPGVGLQFSSLEHIINQPGLRFFNFHLPNSIIQRIWWKWLRFLSRFDYDLSENPKILIDPTIYRKSKRIVEKMPYKCLIGVEKKGLIWAGILAKKIQSPLIYYSLELYIEDHPGIQNYLHLRRAEKLIHQQSDATIIQDEFRARALMKFNEVEKTNLLYLPISVKGGAYKEKSSFLQQKYQLDELESLILYFGLIQEERYSSELCAIAGKMPVNTRLVLHGFGDETYINQLKIKAAKDRVIFSLDFLPETEIIKVISSAKIGLALYPSDSSNDRLAAFSSVKVAYYMQCGVPLIAFRSESFTELIRNYKCGELIDSIDEIPHKIDEILENYNHYRQQSFMAFKHFYDFKHTFSNFLPFFEDFLSAQEKKTEIHN